MNQTDEFLNKYSDILWKDHKDDILFYRSFLMKYLNVPQTTSRFGIHFITCPWAHDTATDGPDTCSCHYVDSYDKKLNKIINWYERNVNK